MVLLFSIFLNEYKSHNYEKKILITSFLLVSIFLCSKRKLKGFRRLQWRRKKNMPILKFQIARKIVLVNAKQQFILVIKKLKPFTIKKF